MSTTEASTTEASTTEAIGHTNDPLAVAGDEEFLYRPLSTEAIASAVFGLLSMVTFVAGADSLQSCLMLAPIPAIGLVVGLRSLAKIRATPDQLSGRNAALAGTLLSAIGLFGGLAYASYVHATEVPQGYQRTSFYQFRPDEVEERRDQMIPPDVQQLDGEQVFIKGFMRPGTHISQTGTPVRHNVSSFLLVRDNNECCFGDISTVKHYDKVLVRLVGSLYTDFSSGMFRVGGKLRVMPENLRRPDARPIYFLEADYLQ